MGEKAQDLLRVVPGWPCPSVMISLSKSIRTLSRRAVENYVHEVHLKFSLPLSKILDDIYRLFNICALVLSKVRHSDRTFLSNSLATLIL